MSKFTFSIKLKSIFFVLLLISILIMTLYFQNRATSHNSLIHIETNYKKNFDNFYKNFERELIEKFEAKTLLLQNNPSKIEEEFLKDVHVKNFKDSKYLQKDKSFINILKKDDEIFYKVIIPTKDDTFVEYVLDARVLLQSLQDFDGSNGILLTGDNNIKNNIFLEEYRNSEYFKELAIKCKKSKSEPFVEFLSHVYVKKEVVLKDFEGKNVANAMFFLDITKDKEAFNAVEQNSLLMSIILFIIASIIVNYFFSYLIKRIEKNEDELKEINKNLEITVEKEIKHRLKSEQLLIQQSKLAMLGEMIGNIAHQWRQPLMQLSAILMYFDAYSEKGKLTPQRLNKKISDANSIIDFMSKTIEDFRNYYKPEKQKEEFLIKTSIDSALFIVNSALRDANIEVVTKCHEEDISLVSYKNEFSQALLNIITNAKDILVQRKVKDAKIDIEVKKEDGFITISIEDNAGGIEEDIIDKIFDPYFTTKHQSQGTGIGLYMTKMIIENNMNGSLEVKNSEKGAKFTISLKG